MGAAGLAPANSLAAIEAALRAGIDLIELDVWRTADHQLVLAHFNWRPPEGAAASDPAISRLRAARTWRRWPRITRSTLAELRLSSPIATLREALDLMRGRAIPYLDLRATGIAGPLCALLREAAPDGAMLGAGPQRSFHEELSIMPTLLATSGVAVPLFGRALSPTALIALAGSAVRRARGQGAAGLSVEYHLLRPPFIDRCHELGTFVFAWTVDQPAAMRRLSASGVDGITTNRPDLLELAVAAASGERKP